MTTRLRLRSGRKAAYRCFSLLPTPSSSVVREGKLEALCFKPSLGEGLTLWFPSSQHSTPVTTSCFICSSWGAFQGAWISLTVLCISRYIGPQISGGNSRAAAGYCSLNKQPSLFHKLNSVICWKKHRPAVDSLSHAPLSLFPPSGPHIVPSYGCPGSTSVGMLKKGLDNTSSCSVV